MPKGCQNWPLLNGWGTSASLFFEPERRPNQLHKEPSFTASKNVSTTSNREIWRWRHSLKWFLLGPKWNKFQTPLLTTKIVTKAEPSWKKLMHLSAKNKLLPICILSKLTCPPPTTAPLPPPHPPLMSPFLKEWVKIAFKELETKLKAPFYGSVPVGSLSEAGTSLRWSGWPETLESHVWFQRGQEEPDDGAEQGSLHHGLRDLEQPGARYFEALLFFPITTSTLPR